MKVANLSLIEKFIYVGLEHQPFYLGVVHAWGEG